ncbi:hypothetical protein AAG906_031133 [Vitis piasezkii]
MVVFSFPYSKGFCSYNFGYFCETLYMAALSGLHCPIDIKDGYFDDFETGFFFSHDYWLDGTSNSIPSINVVEGFQ